MKAVNPPHIAIGAELLRCFATFCAAACILALPPLLLGLVVVPAIGRMMP